MTDIPSYPIDRFVAHRGLQRCYPENSLQGIKAAITAGARHVEMDVQLSADAVPILFHDGDLKRACGRTGSLFDYSAEQLAGFSANEPHRLHQAFEDQTVAPLSALAAIAKTAPTTVFYLELKEESIEFHGLDTCLREMANAVSAFVEQCIFISFSEAAVIAAKQQYGFQRTGLVFRKWSQREILYARTFADVAFINYKRITSRRITSSIPLVVYEARNPTLAHKLLSRGADKVESFAVDQLIQTLCKNTTT